jgi:hypothetical protein
VRRFQWRFNRPECQGNQITKAASLQQTKVSKNATIFTVNKIGKKNDYYVTKALQLYLEGLSYREIERIIESPMSPSAIG